MYNHGSAYVAAQRFNNTPDGRIIHTAFTYNGIMPHGSSFNNCLLFPVEQRLRKTKNFGLRMCPKPIDEISMLHEKTFNTSATTVSEFNKKVAEISGFEDILHVKLKLENVKNKVEFKLNGATITIENDSLYCYGNLPAPFPKVKRTAIDQKGRIKGPLFIDNGKVELEILLDKTTLEIFGNDGELFMPIGLYFFPDFDAMLFGRPSNKLEIKSFMDMKARGFRLTTNNDAKVRSFEVHTMKSIWKK